MGSIFSKTEIIPTYKPKPQMEPAGTSKPQPITADNVRALFPEVGSYLATYKQESPPANATPLKEGDAEQIRMMENEYCIILDEKDKPIGSASKKYCTKHHFSTVPSF